MNLIKIAKLNTKICKAYDNGYGYRQIANASDKSEDYVRKVVEFYEIDKRRHAFQPAGQIEFRA